MLQAMPKTTDAEAPETRLLLSHPELWEGSDVLVLGAPPAEVAQVALLAQGDGPKKLSYCGGEAERPDLVIVYLPKARRRREYLIALASSLATRLVVVGHKRSGIKPTTKRLREMGQLQAIEHGSHCQLVCIELAERLAPPDLDEWEQVFETRGLELITLPGVFSDGRLDAGSNLLLEHLDLLHTGSLLDLGCGSGVLGLWAKHSHPELVVTLSDVDELAVESARRGAQRNGLDVDCVVSDVYSAITERFDRIVTNPPFHQGVATEYDVTRSIISEARDHLTERGELWLVANHFLPWREPLETQFDDVDLVHASTRYKVWRARNVIASRAKGSS